MKRFLAVTALSGTLLIAGCATSIGEMGTNSTAACPATAANEYTGWAALYSGGSLYPVLDIDRGGYVTLLGKDGKLFDADTDDGFESFCHYSKGVLSFDLAE